MVILNNISFYILTLMQHILLIYTCVHPFTYVFNSFLFPHILSMQIYIYMCTPLIYIVRFGSRALKILNNALQCY